MHLKIVEHLEHYPLHVFFVWLCGAAKLLNNAVYLKHNAATHETFPYERG